MALKANMIEHVEKFLERKKLTKEKAYCKRKIYCL